jgi:hypothetical protein
LRRHGTRRDQRKKAPALGVQPREFGFLVEPTSLSFSEAAYVCATKVTLPSGSTMPQLPLAGQRPERVHSPEASDVGPCQRPARPISFGRCQFWHIPTPTGRCCLAPYVVTTGRQLPGRLPCMRIGCLHGSARGYFLASTLAKDVSALSASASLSFRSTSIPSTSSRSAILNLPPNGLSSWINSKTDRRCCIPIRSQV